MPKKKDKTEEEYLTPAVVKITVEKKHLANPHWIELRKAELPEGEQTSEESVETQETFFSEGRLHDMKFSTAIGAKTVETVLRENGANPMLHGEEKLEITFSPYTGEIISILEKAAGEENETGESVT